MRPEAASIDDVLANFDVIIAWAIDNEHGLGYFATVYKRATKSIKVQIEAGAGVTRIEILLNYVQGGAFKPVAERSAR